MLEVGQVFDNNYRIDERIGVGGGGIIFKAYQISMQRNVALKLIKENVKHFLSERSEADILKTLKHKNLPSVFDFVRDGDDVYTVMEFIEGQDFNKLIKSGKHYTEKEVLKFAKQLCEAVVYLHSQNPPIIHSDIKPANIMLTPKGDICLIDFNISTFLGSHAMGDSGIWSAKEQKLDYKQVVNVPSEVNEFNEETRFVDPNDPELTVLRVEEPKVIGASAVRTQVAKAMIDMRTDVYGMGATLYYIATGRLPKGRKLNFSGTNVSPKLQKILNKATHEIPEKRYRSAEKMLRDIEKIGKISYAAAAAVLCLIAAGAFGAGIMGQKQQEQEIMNYVPETVTVTVMETLPIAEENEIPEWVEMGGMKYKIDMVELMLADKNITADELSELKYFEKLKNLSLDGIDLSNADMSFMENLTSLGTLSMKGCNLEKADFLSNVKSLTWLDVKDNKLTNLDFATSLTELTYLCADNNSLGNNLGGVSGLSKLNKLYIDNNGISDISALTDLPDIRELTIQFNEIKDISALSDFLTLEKLHAQKNVISDITPLSGLTSLTFLKLSENQYISDISPLSEMVNLQTLDLCVNSIQDISPVSNLKNLELLLLGNNIISDISMLGNNRKLARVDLYKNVISDISVFKRLPRLTIINIQNNPITDISPLAGHEKLTTLNIAGLGISDLTPISDLTELKNLTIRRNKIADIGIVTEFPSLVNFIADSNNISDITPLMELTELESVSLSENPVSEEDIKLLAEKLPSCEIKT